MVRDICPFQGDPLDRLGRVHIVLVDPRVHAILVFPFVDCSSELAREPERVFESDVRRGREAEDRVGDRGVPYGMQVCFKAVEGDFDGVPSEIYARRVQWLGDVANEL